MPSIDDDEILGYCLLWLGPDAGAAATAHDADDLAAIRDALGEILFEAAAAGDGVSIESRDGHPVATKGMQWAVWRSRRDGQVDRLYSFNICSAAYETALPLLGVVLTLFTVGAGAAMIPQIGGIARTLWGKLVVLKRPENSDAIDVVETIARLRAQTLAAGSDALPTTAAIIAALGIDAEATRAALRWLAEKTVVRVTGWGGQKSDLGHADNRWAIVL